jgi:hypothetical protein
MRLSQLEKAIANLEGERTVLDRAIATMKAQLAAQPPRTSKTTSAIATADRRLS